MGDYGCEFEDGTIVPIYFDRKSIGDLYGTMGKGYRRFKDCISRSQENATTLFLIIEGTLTKVSNGYSRSQIAGKSMVRKLFTLHVKYGVQTIYCKDRAEMSQYITQFFIACGKEHVRRKKDNG